MRLLFLSLALVANVGMASTLTAQNSPPRNARANENLTTSPAPKVGCMALTEAKNTLTPVILYRASADCISQGKYDQATDLFALAGMYTRFDAKRVTDRTATQVIPALIMSTFASASDEQRSKFGDAFTRSTGTPVLLNKLCRQIKQIGMPDYYPDYMIQHGMKAFTGNPDDGALQKDFDGPTVWKSLQSSYLHCPSN